jgi:hypothetical protein
LDKESLGIVIGESNSHFDPLRYDNSNEETVITGADQEETFSNCCRMDKYTVMFYLKVASFVPCSK